MHGSHFIQSHFIQRRRSVNRSILLDRATMFVAVTLLLLVFTVPAAAKKDSGSIDGPSAQADCTAQCQDGSTVTCSGGSCTADDYDCEDNEQGQCTGSSGTKYCPALDIDQCPVTCTASRSCPDGTYIQCFGHFGSDACEGGYPLCYVRCDGGLYQFCPGHFGAVFC
jgi:hypothetical protein